MELPKYHESNMPLLEILGSGEPMNSRKLDAKIREKYFSHLPEDILCNRVQKMFEEEVPW
ncbi:hypothetical protein BC962_2168 [Gillisia mitskevichiae]|uniref:Uncharacterized protein n=1 Tax=Gillisia mitskevichiae TaxID=270921 RepID=A0A495PWG8_9FLAO|nr:hypothetical protein BC962_2168 [Gillisia mitskevichiae]